MKSLNIFLFVLMKKFSSQIQKIMNSNFFIDDKEADSLKSSLEIDTMI